MFGLLKIWWYSYLLREYCSPHVFIAFRKSVHRAAESLGQMRNRRAIRPLERALSSRPSKERTRNSDDIAYHNPLGDEELHLIIVKALAQLGAVEPLTKSLKYEPHYPAVRCAIVRALGQSGDLNAFEALYGDAVLFADDPEVRCAAVRALGQLGEKRAVTRLSHLLFDNDETVRRAAGEVCAELADSEDVNKLVDRITHHSEYQIRRAAAEILVQIARRNPRLLVSRWRSVERQVKQLEQRHVDSHYDRHHHLDESLGSHTDGNGRDDYEHGDQPAGDYHTDHGFDFDGSFPELPAKFRSPTKRKRTAMRKASAPVAQNAKSTLTLTCPKCSQELKVSSSAVGRRGKCPHCMAIVQIPDADAGDSGLDF